MLAPAAPVGRNARVKAMRKCPKLYMLQGVLPCSESSAALIALLPTFRVVHSLVAQLAL